jgi:hypothetical protein
MINKTLFFHPVVFALVIIEPKAKYNAPTADETLRCFSLATPSLPKRCNTGLSIMLYCLSIYSSAGRK